MRTFQSSTRAKYVVWRNKLPSIECPLKRQTVVDRITAEQRSEIMRRVGPRDTKPEIVVRRLVRSLGFRIRTNDKRIPGRPDVVIPALKLVIFVHGCFWHRHTGCSKTTTPVKMLGSGRRSSSRMLPEIDRSANYARKTAGGPS
jgi:DNA mismatch endonuclease Vsr